jgi:uncharacterized protein involved in exopolysaccharide biosynthesis/Mrp family chromosome partitioning ATPase
VLFRWKWLILSFCVVGVGAGLCLWQTMPPVYQSQAKLFIRYVVQGKSLTPPSNEQNATPLNNQEQSIINTELEILKSYDLARQVVDSVGAERILPPTGNGGVVVTNLAEKAALFITKNLIIEPTAMGSVISIMFQHPDSKIAQEVLNKVILVYYKKHAEAHQPVGIFGDFLTQETKRLHDQLTETEQQLRTARIKAGISSPGLNSLNDARTTYAAQISKIRIDLFNAEADLAGRQAMLDQAPSLAPIETAQTNAAPQLAAEVIQKYRNVCARLDGFQKREQELLFSFTEISPMVQEVRDQIVENQKAKKDMETQYPQLALSGVVPASSMGQAGGDMPNLAGEAIQVRALKSRIQVLKIQMRSIQADAAKLDDMEGTIVELQRKKDMEEADLRYFSANLEQASIDDALGTGKAPNIDVIDPPTPPIRARPKTFKKIFAMVTLGPVAAGIALAFLIELFLDTSVKRPTDVRGKLRLPLFISIPQLKSNGGMPGAPAAGGPEVARLTDAKPGAGGEPPEAPGRLGVALRSEASTFRRFCEGLRDRLIVHFEVTRLVHKPKLVALTSCGRGAGVTSLAAELAASLSETGDGKVLFVDMNPGQQGASQLFYKGKPGCGLAAALESETKETAQINENLYVATNPAFDSNLPQVMPKQFTQLVPKFRASDYDYIIFDMPPVSQTSVTPRLAGLMDMVLLVVESEKTKREVVQQASSLLAQSKANVGVVLNKTRNRIPAMLLQELSD